MYTHSQLRDTARLLPQSFDAFLLPVNDPAIGPQLYAVGESETIDRQTRILLVGDDPALQYSRRKILESAGYTVAPARSNVIVEELFLRGIELVLLCHTIPEDIATHILTAFGRLAPQIPVLRISLLNNTLEDGGKPTSVPARPQAFLGAVAATLAHDV